MVFRWCELTSASQSQRYARRHVVRETNDLEGYNTSVRYFLGLISVNQTGKGCKSNLNLAWLHSVLNLALNKGVVNDI